MTAPGMIVASNRGPVSWHRDDGGALVPRRGFGGLVTALGGALQESTGTWVSVALSEADRAVAAGHQGKPFEVDLQGSAYRLCMLDVGERYDAYYNEVANRLLWFTVHQLWGEPYEPAGTGWRGPWEDAYLPVNEEIARAIVDAAGGDEEIHLHDYHLAAVAPFVRRALPDAPILHYIHTPWPGPGYLGRLPDPVARGIVEGLLAADVVAFSAPAWARSFRRCAEALLGATIDGDAVRYGGRRCVVADFVLGVDERDLAASAASEEVAEASRDLEARLGDRALVLRVDRTDLSKNILRGLEAYELLLDRHPEHRGRVWHYAHLNPSRQGVAEYREYLAACLAKADRIRERFGEDALDVFVGDDYPMAVAALRRADVLLTNPVVDGTNLVAKEGPTLSTRDLVVVLSRHAGAADVLDEGALLVNPYDVEAQADALQRALTMPAAERRTRAEALRRAARVGAPDEWFHAQRQVLRATIARRR